MTLSVHVLDTAAGVPAAGMRVQLLREIQGLPREQARGRTDARGRLTDWLSGPLSPGIHQLVFDLGGYFAAQGVAALHPRAIVEFRVVDVGARLHLPLLVTPNSYLTYRGT